MLVCMSTVVKIKKKDTETWNLSQHLLYASACCYYVGEAFFMNYNIVIALLVNSSWFFDAIYSHWWIFSTLCIVISVWWIYSWFFNAIYSHCRSSEFFRCYVYLYIASKKCTITAWVPPLPFWCIYLWLFDAILPCRCTMWLCVNHYSYL